MELSLAGNSWRWFFGHGEVTWHPKNQVTNESWHQLGSSLCITLYIYIHIYYVYNINIYIYSTIDIAPCWQTRQTQQRSYSPTKNMCFQWWVHQAVTGVDGIWASAHGIGVSFLTRTGGSLRSDDDSSEDLYGFVLMMAMCKYTWKS